MLALAAPQLRVGLPANCLSAPSNSSGRFSRWQREVGSLTILLCNIGGILLRCDKCDTNHTRRGERDKLIEGKTTRKIRFWFGQKTRRVNWRAHRGPWLTANSNSILVWQRESNPQYTNEYLAPYPTELRLSPYWASHPKGNTWYHPVNWRTLGCLRIQIAIKNSRIILEIVLSPASHVST